MVTGGVTPIPITFNAGELSGAAGVLVGVNVARTEVGDFWGTTGVTGISGAVGTTESVDEVVESAGAGVVTTVLVVELGLGVVGFEQAPRQTRIRLISSKMPS